VAGSYVNGEVELSIQGLKELWWCAPFLVSHHFFLLRFDRFGDLGGGRLASHLNT